MHELLDRSLPDHELRGSLQQTEDIWVIENEEGLRIRGRFRVETSLLGVLDLCDLDDHHHTNTRERYGAPLLGNEQLHPIWHKFHSSIFNLLGAVSDHVLRCFDHPCCVYVGQHHADEKGFWGEQLRWGENNQVHHVCILYFIPFEGDHRYCHLRILGRDYGNLHK